jgi:hypothetical protein
MSNKTDKIKSFAKGRLLKQLSLKDMDIKAIIAKNR